MLELRAATSLAQLWQQIGRCADARRMLIGVYDKFEQKGDFPELVSAESCCNHWHISIESLTRF